MPTATPPQLSRVLIVEDEFAIAEDLQTILESRGAEVVVVAKSVAEAERLIKQYQPELVLLDIRLRGEQTGIELGRLLNARYRLPFIYITSHTDKHTLQQAAATQPYGYVVKPFEDEEIFAAVDAAFIRHKYDQLAQQQAYLAEEVRSAHCVDDFIGQDPATQEALQLLQQVAPHDFTVLLLGETGAGKELFARALHDLSPRRNQPLVKLNCAALPAQLIESELFGHEKGAFTGAIARRVGKFELAHRGTIFLDEIGELPLELQPKLLRVLQEKEIERVGGSSSLPIDVRVVAATNRDLEAEVAAGRFRADLYYRLSVFPLSIPPLRERPGDIVPLAEFFLARIAKQLGKALMGFDEGAYREMQHYAWPSNVRELQHMVERAALLAPGPVVATLRLQLSGAPKANALQRSAETEAEAELAPPRPLEDVEREAIVAALHYCNGRIRGKGGAAERLQILPTTLDYRMRKLGIQRSFI